jgi:SAM-dependent methyltransferase
MAVKEWQLGTPDTLTYRFYDFLRNRLNGKLVKYLLDHAIPENALILEAGSGPAYASSMLRADDKVRAAIALDIDIEALMEAKQRDPAIPLVVADLCRLPFRDGVFDLCWNSSTVEHLPDPVCAMEEMTRAVKPGGKVFVGVPNVCGPLGFERLISRTAVGVWIGKTFSKGGLENILIKIGLNPERHIFYFFRFFVGILAGK